MADHVATLENERAGAAPPEIGHALAQMDRSIATYVQRCRQRIPSFVESNFSLAQTWRLQRPTLWMDLFLAPLNSAWALPYVAVQKAAEALERVGALRPVQWARRLPSGIRTGYQARIERLICADLLEWDRERSPSALPQGLLKELEAVPALRSLTARLASLESDRGRGRTLAHLLRQLSSGRAIVSDAAGTLLTFALGWITLGNRSVSLHGIAYGMAQQHAQERAASRFFLGERLGSRFYHAFPPEVQESTVWIFLVLLAVGLTAAAMACTILSDPVRKGLGFHHNRLKMLLDEVERDLIVLSHKAVVAAPPPPRLAPPSAGT